MQNKTQLNSDSDNFQNPEHWTLRTFQEMRIIDNIWNGRAWNADWKSWKQVGMLKNPLINFSKLYFRVFFTKIQFL